MLLIFFFCKYFWIFNKTRQRLYKMSLQSFKSAVTGNSKLFFFLSLRLLDYVLRRILLWTALFSALDAFDVSLYILQGKKLTARLITDSVDLLILAGTTLIGQKCQDQHLHPGRDLERITHLRKIKVSFSASAFLRKN